MHSVGRFVANTSFHRSDYQQKKQTKLRNDTDELDAVVLYCERNKKLESLFRNGGLAKVVEFYPFLHTESFREGRRIPNFYLFFPTPRPQNFVPITKRVGVMCQTFDSQTKIARRAKAMSLN